MDKYDEMIDIGAKRTLGLDYEKKEWTYDEIVNQYIKALDYYGNKAPIEYFEDLENFASLNLSLNYFTCEVLIDYQELGCSLDDISLKFQNNEHYRALLEVGNSIRNRFVKAGLESIAEILSFNILLVAELLYNFENDKELYKTKIYS